jgi:hypothetical protein
MRTSRFAGWSAIVFTIAAVLALVMEATAVASGLDPDDAPGTLRFVAEHPLLWAVAAPAYLVMGLALIAAVIGTTDVLAGNDREVPSVPSVPVRAVQAVGIMAAALFVIAGVFRAGGGPLQYMAEIDRAAGIAATAAVIVLTTHGGIQGGVLLLCVWIVAVSIAGLSRRTLPVWLCVLGLVPAVRIALVVLGPLGFALDALWFVAIAVIPWALLWPGTLGIVLLVRFRAGRAGRAGAAASVA